MEQVLHEHARRLLEATAKERGEHEHLPPGRRAEVPQHHREQARPKAVQGRERPPHEAHAKLGAAARDEHPDHLEDEAGHARHDEDDHVVVEARAHVLEVVLAQRLDLLGGEARLWLGLEARVGRVVVLARAAAPLAVDDDLVGRLGEVRGHLAPVNELAEAPAASRAIAKRAGKVLHGHVDEPEEGKDEQDVEQVAPPTGKCETGYVRRRGCDAIYL